ncbi:endonuclease/exonuclease/phosphatase family protein [Bombiscardovia coagulans]|uniref:Endonuclease/exonuclease/phosphatase family protein n=1 Tax=Bombiscardovia coagulans TaxID=686666 RepID=A0A261EUZ4_9BIFI|nr:endonuclease/exonuclease/phosphatase family protein [Bombiscardovia coagulans]OZG50673.1 endonuclease/exonuclease/phosphatase family protein [Bombiscardovia coagulans]
MALRFLPPGWDWHRPLPELIALIPLLSAPLLIIIVWSLVEAAWAQTIVGTLLLTLEALWELPFLVKLPNGLLPFLAGLPPRSQPNDSGSRQHICMMTLNCRYGKASVATIRNLVESKQVEVLALQEVTQEFLKELDTTGIQSQLPYRSVGPTTKDDNGGCNALFSKIQPLEQQSSSVTIPASAVPTMTLPLNNTTLRIASAHPKSPQRGAMNWGNSILALSALNLITSADPLQTVNAGEETQQHKASTSSFECVILGDLNSSLYHPSFRRMLKDGRLLDGAVSLHQGIHPTFPANWPALPPLIEIDHILHSPGLMLQSLETLHVAGTDHLGLLAHISECEQEHKTSH